jgi:predicted DNA-binding protein with PD1-like motif
MSEVILGRIATVRIAPNEDLIHGLEQAAARLGFGQAMVRSGLGSLIDAAFERHRVAGPVIELVSLFGEIGPGTTTLSGLVGDPSGAVSGGRFLPGANPVCITVEAVLEEISPEAPR